MKFGLVVGIADVIICANVMTKYSRSMIPQRGRVEIDTYIVAKPRHIMLAM